MLTADWCPFLWTMSEVDVLGWTGVQCIGPKLGICDMAQNSWVAVAKSVCHAPEHPLCKTVGRVIPYQGVVRILVQVRIFYCSRAEPSLNRGKGIYCALAPISINSVGG